MSDIEHRDLDCDNLLDGSQEAETDRHHVFIVPVERPGRVYFVLLSEFSERTHPNQEFELEGPDLQISDKTDDNAHFEFSPVEMGEYQLTVGEETYDIPAVEMTAPPHPVNARYVSIPEQRDAWEGPTEEEINETDLDPVAEPVAE